MSLSELKDKFGRKKLDPKSVIFVANFWDKVPRKDEEVSDHVINRLSVIKMLCRDVRQDMDKLIL